MQRRKWPMIELFFHVYFISINLIVLAILQYISSLGRLTNGKKESKSKRGKSDCRLSASNLSPLCVRFVYIGGNSTNATFIQSIHVCSNLLDF